MKRARAHAGNLTADVTLRNRHGRNNVAVMLIGHIVKFFITWCLCGVGVNTFEILSIKGNQLSR